MKRNITIQLDDSLTYKTRIVAARRSVSISRLVAQQIERAAATDDDYGRAKTLAFAHLSSSFHLSDGAPVAMPSRKSLHER
ncbi:MAG: hypothetical protein ACR2FM_00265 [Candidatus Saccharimonadales bacterium]